MKEIIKKLIETHHALYRVTDLLPLREPLRKMLRENANTLLTYIVVGGCQPAQAGGGKAAENAEFRINIGAKIEAMQNTISVAKDAGYCHPVNFEVLQREYEEIGKHFTIHQDQLKEKSIENPIPIGQDEILAKKEDDFVRVFEEGPVSVLEEKKKGPNPATQLNVIKSSKNGDSSFNERQQAIVDFIKERKEAKSTDLATIFSNRFSLKTLQRDLVALIQNKVIEKEGEKRWAVYRMNPVRNIPLHTGF